MPNKILIVEDECNMREIISSYMSKNGFTILEASDGLEAMVILKTQSIDLIILDIMIPYLDGFAICKYVREDKMTPIIMLTAKNSESDKLKGYELGADDYMTKPISIKVLVAKVKALLRRASNISCDDILQEGNICMNQSAQTISIFGEEIDFTYKEYALLQLLMKNQGKVFSREELLLNIWGYDYDGNTRTVDTHIKRIRAKLGEEARHIITLIKSGYKFEVKNEQYKKNKV
ncbi:response regulator transcription factor [Oceanirhabdus seepicola]|uniref:Stage 0 sporulation protein A homolog n=1 Tax=Oceanirhabdus seepicola TaxID=2828781 RepID=A0A9J6NZR2_9CLOT|nr:response regulator transcription factor [Oceanirhabdus seepicola]MCM1989369.1 response regulator transcription factor [Oceanirhabdus seepicola]